MANLPGTRLRNNNIFGAITDNPLTAGALSFNSLSLSGLAVVSGDHVILTLDPLRQYGNPEIIMVTAHSSSATVATITRAMYGTAARSHPQGTFWTHAGVTNDSIEISTSITHPADPYRGQSVFETDTNRYVGRTTSDTWQQYGLFFDPPTCRVFHSVDGALISNATQTVLGTTAPMTAFFNSERWDTDSMHSTVTNPGRITFNTAGLYTVKAHIQFVTNGTGERYVFVRLNGTTNIGYVSASPAGITDDVGIIVTTDYKFTVNDYVEVVVYQTSGGTLALHAAANSAPEFSATWIGRGN